METNKTILQREIISLEDRGAVGLVTEVLVDYTAGRVGHLCITEPKTGAQSYLAVGSIVSAGNPYITIKNKSVLIPENSTPTAEISKKEGRLINVEILSAEGDHFDFVKGFEFDPQSGAMTSLETYTSGPVEAQSILFLSKEYVCVDKGQTFAENLSYVDATSAQEEPAPASVSTPETYGSAQTTFASEPDTFSSAGTEDDELNGLLLGAVLGDDVTSKDGEFFVAKGTTITEEILADAQLHDAVLLLTMNVDI